jgi:CubicO group peptidase (beta-lactamase class C family)
MKKKFLLVALVLFAVSAIFGQSSTPLERTLDSLLATLYKPDEPGMAVLVAKKGKIVYEKAVGSANMELNVPLRPDMVFKIGSVTKQFTAIGILQLWEQGKLSLQDSIQQYVPDFPWKGYTIRIEHLLTHTSGIRDFQTIDHPDPYILRHEFTPEFIINHFKNAPLLFAPGSRYDYSNSGYTLLAYIIAKVSGKSYHDYMKTEVLQRAGLTKTYYANENEILPNRVSGYTHDRGYYENADLMDITVGYGAGDLLSTIGDLYKWNNALWAGKLVKKETLDKAFTPYQLANGRSTRYGYGWFIDTLGGAKCIKHEGQVWGFISGEFYFPEQDIFVAFSTNVQSGEDTTDFSGKRFALMYKIPSAAIGESLGNGVSVPSALLDKYVGTYKMDNRTIIVTKEGNQLQVRQGNNNLTTRAISTTKFLLPDLPTYATLEFVSDQKGQVTKIIALQGGQAFEWLKVK